MTAKKKTVRKDLASAKNARVLKTERATAGLEPPAAPSDTAGLSICVACAKHPSLKRFVKDHGVTGYECGICHRSDLVASAPAKREALSSLVRALIRFYYDEWTYNGLCLAKRSYTCEINDLAQSLIRSFPLKFLP
jgi:hypothetical protein